MDGGGIIVARRGQTSSLDILITSNLACFIAYLLLGVQLGVRRTLGAVGLAFVFACGSTALAALVRGLEGLWGENLCCH